MSVPVDLTSSSDLQMSIIPPDMSIAPCTMPMPGFYIEQVSYTYQNLSGGSTIMSFSTSTVVVKNDGSFLRPDPISTADRFHCAIMPIDPALCTARCCDGDPSTTPTMYFASSGWRMLKTGSCVFKDTNMVSYVANISAIQASHQ